MPINLSRHDLNLLHACIREGIDLPRPEEGETESEWSRRKEAARKKRRTLYKRQKRSSETLEQHKQRKERDAAYKRFIRQQESKVERLGRLEQQRRRSNRHQRRSEEKATHHVAKGKEEQPLVDTNTIRSFIQINCNDWSTSGIPSRRRKQEMVKAEADTGKCMYAECELRRNKRRRHCRSQDACEKAAIHCECGPDCGEKCDNRKMEKKESARVEVLQTNDKGHGLFIKERRRQGEFILEFIGEVKQTIGKERYYVVELQKGWAGTDILYIDPKQKGNLARYMNHSCEPNVDLVKWESEGLPRIGVFANRDIFRGEELCFDYRWEKQEGVRPIKCMCGSQCCRGTIEL